MRLKKETPPHVEIRIRLIDNKGRAIPKIEGGSFKTISVYDSTVEEVGVVIHKAVEEKSHGG